MLKGAVTYARVGQHIRGIQPMTLFRAIACAAVLLGSLMAQPSHAIESYAESDNKQFMDWCTLQKSASEGICSCALKQVAQTVPATALSQYLVGLSSGQSTSLSALATSSASVAAVTVTQSLATCAS